PIADVSNQPGHRVSARCPHSLPIVMETVLINQLIGRGWTRGMVMRFLGAADETATNPHYRSGPPLRLYSQARVVQAEANPEVVAALAHTKAKLESRRASARKAVATKVERAKCWMSELIR